MEIFRNLINTVLDVAPDPNVTSSAPPTGSTLIIVPAVIAVIACAVVLIMRAYKKNKIEQEQK